MGDSSNAKSNKLEGSFPTPLTQLGGFAEELSFKEIKCL